MDYTCYKMKARSTVITIMMVAVMVVASCGSVFAASLGVANVSDRVYRDTEVTIEVQPNEDLQETVTNEYIPMEEGAGEEIDSGARSNMKTYAFSWNLKKNQTEILFCYLSRYRL